MIQVRTKRNGVVIGYGGMGSWHAQCFLNSDAVHLSGIYDIDPSKSKQAEDKGIRAYHSWQEVLADGEVDFVTLAVPNELHRPLAIEAMAAGKHVVSEKPVTLSSEDLQAIYDASYQYDRLFTVHQNRRWDADYLMMKQLYENKMLGEVFAIESRVQGSRGIPGDWRGKKEHGGGMMLDWGVHLIDQMIGIVNDRKIERVYCRCDHITNDEVDDGFKLDLYFEGGLTARIEVGTSHFIFLGRFYMNGVNGSAKVAGWGCNADITYCKDWSVKDAKPVVTEAGLTKTMAPRTEDSIVKTEIERPKVDVHDFYRNFVAAINGDASMLITHAQVMRVMLVMEAAFESDRTGLPVVFNDPGVIDPQ